MTVPLSSESPRRAAAREFGNAEFYREVCTRCGNKRKRWTPR